MWSCLLTQDEADMIEPFLCFLQPLHGEWMNVMLCHFSTEWTTLSTLPLSNSHEVWWAEWACWSWVEWSHFRRLFLLNAWPVKLTHCVKLSHTLPKAVTSDKHIGCVSKSWNTGRYMLLLLLRRHLFVLRGKTALHNPLLLLPTLHSNYLTECEGMSR